MGCDTDFFFWQQASTEARIKQTLKKQYSRLFAGASTYNLAYNLFTWVLTGFIGKCTWIFLKFYDSLYLRSTWNISSF
jgi:hypothetical protein